MWLHTFDPLLVFTSKMKSRESIPNSREDGKKGIPSFWVTLSIDLEKSTPRSPLTYGMLWEPKCQRRKYTCTIWMQPVLWFPASKVWWNALMTGALWTPFCSLLREAQCDTRKLSQLFSFIGDICCSPHFSIFISSHKSQQVLWFGSSI